MKVLVTLFCFITLFFIVKTDFNEAVQQLARFQEPQLGSFVANFNSAPSLEATTDALFLSSLYGLQNKINSFGAEQYLQTLRTKDNGYSSTAGGLTTLEATFNAVVSYVHLGKEVPHSSAVVDYVLSLVDANKLFSNSVGGRGNIKSTYHAIATLKALGSLDSLPANIANDLREFLTSSLTPSNVGKYFSFPGVPAIKGNFYAVYIWEALNEDVLDVEDNFSFVMSQQKPTGGFFMDVQRTSATYESSSLALSTLSILSDYSISDYNSQVNTGTLIAFCKNVPVDLTEVAHAHKAIAHTQVFSENFKFVVEYGGADTRGNIVLQGTQLRPEIVVRSFNGPSHANVNVFVSYNIENEIPKKLRLVWDEESQSYVAPQGIDTSNKIGKIFFEYDMQIVVFGVGPIHFSQSAEKNIGYRITVIPTATSVDTQASISAGDVVSANTEFEFSVKLANKTHSNILVGDFDVVFTVLDSAYSSVYQDVISAMDNDVAFKFDYLLKDINIPAGELTFLFAAKDDVTTYSNEVVTYLINVPMVASNIELSDSDSTLGSEFTISCIPANYPASGEIVHLANTIPASSRQRFYFADISTKSGVLVNSIEGVSEGISGRYSFSYTIPTSFDSLGSFVVTFRYESAKGSIDLENFDSGDISEDPIEFSIQSDLIAEVLERPTSTEFSYGNDISYRFKVNDKVTGSSLNLGKRGGVFLNLNHFDKVKGKSYVSTRLPASQDGSDLVINWNVNPNAVQGDGNLVLVAEGPGGDEIPLLVNGKQFSSDITIGGEIKEETNVFSTTDYYSSQTAFVVEFELSCNTIPLRDVKLRANIFYEGSEINSVPVGVSGDKYLASWNSLHVESPSGTYEVKFYREADQQRAADNEEWKQKQLRSKQREAELSGEEFDATKFLNSLESVEVEPLFSVTIPHKQVSRGGLPFGTEWLVIIPTFIAFLYFDNVKRQYRNGNRN